MAELTGKAALALHEQIKRENEQKRHEALARAKADAAARGKQAFDFEKLEKLAPTDAVATNMTRDERAAYFEEMYYVTYPNVMTLDDLATKIDELSKWS